MPSKPPHWSTIRPAPVVHFSIGLDNTSHLTYWRKQWRDGALKELGRTRGRKQTDKRDAEIASLTRRAERAEAELEKARKVIEIQGNLSALLEQMLGTEGESRSTGR